MNLLTEYIDSVIEGRHPRSDVQVIHDIETGERVSITDLARMVVDKSELLKSGLSGRSARPVLIKLDKRLDYVVNFLSVIYAGFVAVPVADEWNELVADAIMERLNPVALLVDSNVEYLDGIAESVFVFMEDENVVLHSSGTTNTPKSIIHSVDSMIGNANAMSERLSITDKDRHLVVLPLNHAHALGFGLLSSLMNGASVYLGQFSTPARWASMVREFGITVTSLVPPMVSLINQSKAGLTLEGDNILDLRFVLISSAALPASDARKFLASTGVPIVHGWGQSELSNFVTCTGVIADLDRVTKSSLLSVGAPITGCSVDVEGKESSPGEIKVSSLYAAKRIVTDKGEISISDYHNTGDLGFTDGPDLFVQGRNDDIIIKGSLKYSPLFLEEHISDQVDSIKQVVVFSDKDGSPDQPVYVYVVPLSSQSDDAKKIQMGVRKAMARYFIPNRIIVGDEERIPMTHTGKLQRNKMTSILRDQL